MLIPWRVSLLFIQDGVDGSLVQLEVTKPMCLWSWKHNAGMYAYICMPEYAKLYLGWLSYVEFV